MTVVQEANRDEWVESIDTLLTWQRKRLAAHQRMMRQVRAESQRQQPDSCTKLPGNPRISQCCVSAAVHYGDL